MYLGATQHSWSSINLQNNNGYYNAINSCGTFAYAIKNTIYDPLLKKLKKLRHPVDHYLIFMQKENRDRSIVFYPNIIIADLTDSDIRGPRNQLHLSKRLKWDKIKYNF